MKHKIKQAILKKILNNKELKKLKEPDIVFPGGLTPINETQDQDVFIVGFPKSGNTWMQHIITHLVYGVNGEASRSMVNLIVSDIYANSHYFRFNERCFFKSHDLPKPNYKKVVYIMRDGREALLSYFHMKKNMGNPVSMFDLYSGNIKLNNASWSEHIEQWEQNPYGAEILWLKYEDLKADRLKELKRVCAFLNIERSDSDIDQVMDLTSMEHMKTLEKRMDWVKMNKNYFVDNKTFLRKGKTDSYKNEVSKEIINIFEKNNSDLLSKYY